VTQLVVSAAEARILLGRKKRSRKRREQLLLNLGLSISTPRSLYLAGVVHPPINEWKAWPWQRYRIEKAKWHEWIAVVSQGMERVQLGQRVDVEVTCEFNDGRAHDPDGYTPKFALDALVIAGVLPCDSYRTIRWLRIQCVRAAQYGTLVQLLPVVA
jgi:hypothetical protein